MVASYLVTEEHTTNRGSKSHGQTARACNTEHFSHLPAISTVLRKPPGNQISNTSRYVHKGPFFSKIQAGTDGENGTHGLDGQHFEVEKVGNIEA